MTDLIPAMQSVADLPSFTFTTQRLLDGHQIVFRLPNNYGLSVVRHFGSYGGLNGLWEAVVILFHGDSFDDWDIAGEPEGWLDVSEIETMLRRVAVMP